MARPTDKRRRKEGRVRGKRHVDDVTARPRLRGGQVRRVLWSPSLPLSTLAATSKLTSTPIA